MLNKLLNSGGDEEDRTPDLRIANATLSQLSYVPTPQFMIMRKAYFDNPRHASAVARSQFGQGLKCGIC
jgi:hypothetical protein